MLIFADVDPKEHTKSRRTQPMAIGRSQMHIRSVRIANKKTSMSGDHNPANPPTSPPHSPQNNKRPSMIQQAVDSLIQSHQRCQRPEVSLETLRRLAFQPTSAPLPAISAIVAEGSLIEPQSTFADAVGSLSPSGTQR